MRGELTLGAPADGGGMSALSDGQEVTLVEGAQGGFHVWLDYRLRDVRGTVTLERSAHRVSDGAIVLRFQGAIDVGAPDASGAWQAPAPTPMFMCPTPIGISVIGEAIDYELRVSDGGGELAKAAVTLVPRCPDAQRDFCTRICSG